ncbi:MAG: hypothetical protein CSA25_01495 [Desulfobacter postgatei]|uniref:SGNH/GDSL hydrolase family protein n=1 Tax=Desulfobacter postgatei TaxID=2293 RepID=A0A2G6MSS9_9BACT|nr:MAG: hypothetical protein CSA25_01495 [Desulfobacter postgatei]
MSGKQFIIKLVIFGALNLFILTLLLYSVSGRHRDMHLSYAQTESNLLVIGKNEHYPIVFLGTSRGRVFSRDGNHEMVEKILGKKVANLSKGGGGGLMPMDVHLCFFMNQGNTADHIIYLVDPFVFYSSINNEHNDFFLRDEPFELFIFLKLIKDRYPLDRLSSYLQNIAVTDWRKISRYAAPGLTNGRLKKIDEEKLEKARKHYLEKCDRNSFVAYGHVVDDINRRVKTHGATITYVMLPLLMPDFPGLSEVDAFLRETADRQAGVFYINCASCMQDKKFYYDHMHFNKTGIAYFLKHCILPIF